MHTLSAYKPTRSSITGIDVPVLRRLMDKRALHCVFQPIADLAQAHVFAHEALIRGPQDTPYHSPDALLAMARADGLMHAFELHCVVTALEQWGQARHPGRLFVNISADALVHAWSQAGIQSISHILEIHHVTPRKVVLELTEHERVTDIARLREVAKGVHSLGMQIALDDFGDGRSSLRLWSEIKPDYVKIDKYFAQNISQNPEQLQVVQAIREIATIFGTALVAEGMKPPTTCGCCATWACVLARATCWGGRRSSPNTMCPHRPAMW